MALVLLALAVVAAVTLVLYPISEIDPGVSSGVLYVLGVLIVTASRGLRLGLATAVASALALDYFHTDPTGQFVTGKSAGDIVAIFSVTLTAVVGALIADCARRRAVESEERRVRLRRGQRVAGARAGRRYREREQRRARHPRRRAAAARAHRHQPQARRAPARS